MLLFKVLGEHDDEWVILGCMFYVEAVEKPPKYPRTMGYWNHQQPHIHVKYQNDEVIVSIPEGQVLDGKIPPSKMKLLQAWIELHKDELIADWELAVAGEQPYKIEPLR